MIGSVSWDQIKTIAEDKMADLNAFSVDSHDDDYGTARSMGLTVKGGTAPQKNKNMARITKYERSVSFN